MIYKSPNAIPIPRDFQTYVNILYENAVEVWWIAVDPTRRVWGPQRLERGKIA